MAGGGGTEEAEEPEPPKQQPPAISYYITIPPSWRESLSTIHSYNCLFILVKFIKKCDVESAQIL